METVPQIFVFDIDEKVQAVLGENDYFSAKHTDKLSGENFFDIEVDGSKENEKARFVKEGNYVGFFDLDNNFQMFEIKYIVEEHTNDGITKNCHCEHVVFELLDHIIEDVRPQQRTAEYALTQALNGTRWTAGNVDNFGVQSTNFYYENVISAMNNIRETWLYKGVDGQPTQGIFRYRLVFDVDNMEITDRFIDFVKVVGEFTGKRFEYGKDITEITRVVDFENVFTAAYGRGKGEEVGEYVQDEGTPQETVKTSYGRRTTFKDVEWVKSLTPLIDEDFEENVSGVWLINFSVADAGNTFERDTTFSHTEATSLKITTEIADPQVSLFQENLGVEEGRTYSARCLVYLEPGFVDPNAYIGIQYRDSNGLNIPGGFSYTVYSDYSNSFTTGKWIFMEHKAIAPTGAVTAVMQVGKAGNMGIGTMWFDRMRFGHRADKPLGQEWLEDTEATAKWGRGNNPLAKIKRMGIFTNDEILDPTILIQLTWDFIQAHKEPRISYEMAAGDLERLTGREHEKVRLGDIAYALDREFATPIKVLTRVIEIERDLLQPEETKFVFGNFIDDITDIMELQKQLEKKVSDKGGVWDRGTIVDLGNDLRFKTEDIGEPIPTDPLTPPVSSREAVLKIQIENPDGTKETIGGFFDTHFEYIAARFGRVYADNIINIHRDKLTFYLNNETGSDDNTGLTSDAPMKTWKALVKKIPRVILADISVTFQNTSTPWEEDIEIWGFMGNGLFEIKLQSNTIAGKIDIRGCACPMWIRGAGGDPTLGTSYAKVNTVRENVAPCEVRASTGKVRFSYIWASAEEIAQCCYFVDGSNVFITNSAGHKANSDFQLTGQGIPSISAAIIAKDNARVQTQDCRGYSENQQYGVAAFTGSVIAFKGTPSTGFGINISRTYVNNATQFGMYQYLGTADWALTASPGNPVTSNPQTTITVNATATKSWRTKYFDWRNDNNRIYQGEWQGYGNHYGYVFFGTGFAPLTGKTIKSAKVYLKRTTGGGYGTKQNIRVWGHNYEAQPTLTGFETPQLVSDYGNVGQAAWGEEVILEMPSQFLTDVSAGTVKGIALHVPQKTPYVIMEAYPDYAVKIVFNYE